MQTRKNGKQRSRLGRRLLANQMTAARLWLPDKELLKEVATKRRITEAELLRDIVHRWAVVERRAPGTQEDLKDEVLIDLQKETLGKLDAGLKSIAEHLGLLVDGSARFGDTGVDIPIEQPDLTGDEVPIEQVDVARDQVSPEEQLAGYKHIAQPVAKRINNHLKATVEREGLMSLLDPLRHEGHVEHIVKTLFETAHEYEVELNPSLVRQIAEHLFTSLRNGMERKNQHLLDPIDPRTPPDTEPEQEADYSSSENN